MGDLRLTMNPHSRLTYAHSSRYPPPLRCAVILHSRDGEGQQPVGIPQTLHCLLVAAFGVVAENKDALSPGDKSLLEGY